VTNPVTRFLPADPASRAATFSLLLNAVSMVVKLSVGVVSGSVAVLSDGIDSLEDFIASGIALASVRYGARPPDKGHPYGHGGAETIAATIQAMLIGIGGVFILYNSVRRIIDPPDSIHVDLAIVVMLLAAVANFTLVQYTSAVARRTRSPAITSEARHLMTNVVQAVAVTVGLVAVYVTDEVALDGVIAFALGCYLLWIAAGILRTSIGEVLETSLAPAEVAQLEDVIREVTGHAGAHDLRTRRLGQVRQVDFHMTFPAEMTVLESHSIINEVEDRIESLWPGTVVTVHAEPQSEPPKQPPV
jgi:cation diffusion facilitator family transporter